MKKVKYIIFALISLFIFQNNVFAALNLSKTSVTVGDSFTASVSFTAAAWEVHLNSNGPVSNCYINEADSTSNASNASKTFKATCKTTGTGTVTLTLSGNYTNESGAKTTLSEKKTVKVNAKPAVQPKPQTTYTQQTPKSANNNLSNLEVEGAELNVKFDSGTTEYEVTMPSGTKEVNIIATKADSKASVSGAGIREVTDGPNNIEVIVKSESGLSKTYTLIITVEEEALPVRFGGNDYTFIRRATNLPKVSSYYSVTTTKYNDTEVPAYYSEVTDLTLVGLKDEKGKSYLFMYNPDKHSFNLYSEINLGNIAVFIKKPSKDNMIADLKETTVNINEDSYKAYQFDLNSEYYLIYGTNANTNNTGWFIYDSEENTLQRYNMSEVFVLTKQRDKLFIAVKLLGSICVLSILFMVVVFKMIQKKKI